MYLITPLVPGAIDAMTGNPYPEKGLQREILLPPDHHSQRTGDVSITEVVATPPAAPQPAPKPSKTA